MAKVDAKEPGLRKATILSGNNNYRIWKKELHHFAHSKGATHLLQRRPAVITAEIPEDPLAVFLKSDIVMKLEDDATEAERRAHVRHQFEALSQSSLRIMAEKTRLDRIAQEENILDGKILNRIALSVTPLIRIAIDTYLYSCDAMLYLEQNYGLINLTAVDTLNSRLMNLRYTNPRVTTVFAAVADLVSQLEYAGDSVDANKQIR